MTKAAVVDTNVVVSGLLTDESDAATAKILDSMLDGELDYVLSVELLTEYREVLSRPRIAELHELADDELEQILETIAFYGVFREPVETGEAPDPGDQHLWDLLAISEDVALVTGDKLLMGEAPSDVSVLSPSSYLELLDQS